MNVSQAASPQSPPRRRRWWHWLLFALLALVIALALALGALLWWASTPGALPRALQLAQKYLPDGQQLQFEQAQGSLTGGGTIGRLHWSMPGTEVTLEQFRLDWRLADLWNRALNVRALEAGRIHVRLTPQPDKAQPPSEPFALPQDLSLPLRVDVPLRVKRLEIETVAQDGSASLQALDDIAAQYSYDGALYQAQLQSLHYQQSQLQADVRLHAQTLEVDGHASAYLAGLIPERDVAMLVPLSVRGTLAGGAGAALQAHLKALQLPADFAAPVAAAEMLQAGFAERLPDGDVALRLDAQAGLHPWRSQPLARVEVVLRQFNARDFHPQAPQTALSGSARALPAGEGAASLADAAWDVLLDIDNPHSGAWDAQRVPVAKVQADVQLAPDIWRIRQAGLALSGDGSLTLQGQIDPRQPGGAQLRATLAQIDLRQLLGSLPKTGLGGQLSVEPIDPQPDATLAQASWNIQGELRNADAGLLDAQQLPLDRLLLQARITPEHWRVEALQAHLGDGSVQLEGQFEPQSQALRVRGQLARLPLARVHGQLAAERAPDLSGTLQASGNLRESVAFEADIRSDGRGQPGASRWNVRALQAQGQWSPAQLLLQKLHLDAFQAKVDAQDVQAALPGLESVQARLSASAPGLELNADAAMRQQSGGGTLALNVVSAERLLQWLRQLPFAGSALPELQASGSAQFNADWQGGWQQWAQGLQNPATQPGLRLNAQLQSSQLHLALPAAAQQGQPAAQATNISVEQLQASVQGNLHAATVLAKGDATANGTRAVLDAQLQLAQIAPARNAAGPAWNIGVNQLQAAATLPGQQAPWRLAIAQGLQITAQTGSSLRIAATAGSASLTPPAQVAPPEQALALSWQALEFARDANGGVRLQSQGNIRGVQAGWLDALAPAGRQPLRDAGLFTNLVVNGQWDIALAERLVVNAGLQRESGDLWFGQPAIKAQEPGGAEVQTAAASRSDAIAAGIRALTLELRSQGEALEVALNWDTERAGTIDGKVQAGLERDGQGWSLPENAALSGQIKAAIPDLGVWAFVAPPGWRISGALDADVALAGTLQAPQLRGGIAGNGLNLRSVLDGVDLHDGTLRATLEGSRLAIGELVFQGGTGSYAYVPGLSGNRTPAPTERGRLTASGSIDWSGALRPQDGQAAADSGIALDVQARLHDMQVLVRNDRQVTLAGELAAGLQNGALRLRGDLRVVRASISLPESGAPTLGDDVVVVRSRAAVAEEAELPVASLQTGKPMDMEIRIGLGRDFALQGYGITTRLEGDLTVRSQQTGNDPFSITGEIRTDEGRYRAWGQALNVQTGVVLFNGPYNNPSLNMLAIRPNIDVTAGVRVTGTALAPRVQLYSEPELPDAEKLSWVVLGRAPASGGAEGNAMQQAALGLLAGSVGNSLAGGLGFDEVGLSAEGVSVGKRLSDQLYVTYAASMSGAAGTLYVFYDITRRLTARGETGEQSAVDLIYTISYD